MRSSSRLVALVALVAAGAPLVLGGQQALADPGEPDATGMVTVDRATTTSLTLSWPEASGADTYLVERGSDVGMVNRVVVERTHVNRTTITGLRPGSLYCFQVRAADGNETGPRSNRACQRTVATEGDDTGPVYRVVTYNVCSRACAGWDSRRADAAALVAARRPDVVMLTEATPESGMAAAIGGMTQVVAKSGKALLFRKDAFTVAHRNGSPRTGVLDLGSGRYAVWAELVDNETAQHVVFVSVHLSPGKDAPEFDEQRRRDATHLVAGLQRVNPGGLPVVVGGDFNSYEQRRYDAPGAVMRGAGLADSFWRAHKWRYGNYNTGNRGSAVPEIGKTWGRHIDQVWAEPGRTQVLKWRNAAAIEDGRYVPLPSNHNPVLVRLRVNL
ncbi:MAG: hypothetical protein AVDCRST_MAG36-2826 [uncultured Nocardioidaceae bacterium]|uniref:Fibronectin type-III domain-containing protein n=1 Tax=uncultured Nocardioidaceae bacterium TaxID=253824 RepID=A0A6J4MLR4_9ACTN|nr:MAG: hypothetical protein AVDCRST_MAG36-2826 [uncultured Nocardioidaceae bacterium]